MTEKEKRKYMDRLLDDKNKRGKIVEHIGKMGLFSLCELQDIFPLDENELTKEEKIRIKSYQLNKE